MEVDCKRRAYSSDRHHSQGYQRCEQHKQTELLSDRDAHLYRILDRGAVAIRPLEQESPVQGCQHLERKIRGKDGGIWRTLIL